MEYDDHYRIAIFVDGHKHLNPYPPSFWFDPPTGPGSMYPEWRPYRWSKSTRLALHLHGMRDILFRVEYACWSNALSLMSHSLALAFVLSVQAPDLARALHRAGAALYQQPLPGHSSCSRRAAFDDKTRFVLYNAVALYAGVYRSEPTNVQSDGSLEVRSGTRHPQTPRWQ